MPITKSAKKALRQNIKKRRENLRRKGKIKSLISTLRKFLAESKKEEAQKLLPQIYKALDKAVKKNTIKKNTASRRKSRITKLVSPGSQNQT